MGFDQLPTFPQGGAARADSGNQGIPPEQFQQALQDAGSTLITSTKKPEDSPAIQAALGAEVDALLAQVQGQASPPAQTAPTAPAPQAPNTPPVQQSQSPAAPGDLSERIRRVMEKYSSPEELAKAYLHTDAARTQAQQRNATEFRTLSDRVGYLTSLVERYVAPGSQPPTLGPSAGASSLRGPASPSGTPEDPEEFFKNPAENIRRLMDERMSYHLSAYNEAQARYSEQVRYEQLKRERDKEITALRPFMDEVYAKDRDVYESLPRDRALNLILERARERQEALQARAYHQEISQILGGAPAGTPAGAAPAPSGALPSPGGVSRRFESPANGNWSNTPNFNQLWKARSDSTDEMKVATDILKERGFGEHIPIY